MLKSSISYLVAYVLKPIVLIIYLQIVGINNVQAQVSIVSTDTLDSCVKAERTIFVTNEASNSVADAELRSNTGVLVGITDSTGVLKLSTTVINKYKYLTVNAVGYSTQLIAMDSLKPMIKLQKNSTALPDMIVVSFSRTKRLCTETCGFRCVTACKLTKKQDSIQKPKYQPMVRVYPNPAARGNVVTLELKSTNAALIECVDNNGVVVWRKSFPEGATPLTLALPIPSSWAAGIYHIRVIRPLQAPQMHRLLIQ
jgi:hypothetical protein